MPSDQMPGRWGGARSYFFPIDANSAATYATLRAATGRGDAAAVLAVPPGAER